MKKGAGGSNGFLGLLANLCLILIPKLRVGRSLRLLSVIEGDQEGLVARGESNVFGSAVAFSSLTHPSKPYTSKANDYKVTPW